MDSTVAYAPPFEAARRSRPTWGFAEGDELAPGRTVLRRIGGGRRHEALLVWDEHRLAVLVAKVLRPDQASDERALRDLRREADLLQRLAHPVLVRGFGAVLEGPRPGRSRPALGLHVASALHYLAAEGIVHLDVKPSNIVMGGPPRLIDLSVARTVAEARWPQLTAAPAPLPRRTPPELAAAVLAGLDPAPASRPTARDLAVALEPLVAALPRRMTLGRR